MISTLAWLGVIAAPAAATEMSGPGASDPKLVAEIEAYFEAAPQAPLEAMTYYYDTEKGFVWFPDNYDEALTSEAQLREIAGRYAAGFEKSDVEKKVVFARDLGNGYVSVATWNRGTRKVKNRPPRYNEWRSAYVLRRDGDTFKVAQQTDGLPGMLVMIPKLYERSAEAWDAREKKKP
jgi:hypothetical protein